MNGKERGQELISKARNDGEQLHPSMTPSGRELIRVELRALQERWESFEENLERLSWTIDRTMSNLKQYNSMSEEIAASLKRYEGRLGNLEISNKNTLQEKKNVLQMSRASSM